MLNPYKPGMGIHLTVTAQLLGLDVDPTTLTAYIHGPDGTLITPSVVRDSLGVYHADAGLPLSPPAVAGVWSWRWVATGSGPSNQGLAEGRFIVEPLDY